MGIINNLIKFWFVNKRNALVEVRDIDRYQHFAVSRRSRNPQLASLLIEVGPPPLVSGNEANSPRVYRCSKK